MSSHRWSPYRFRTLSAVTGLLLLTGCARTPDAGSWSLAFPAYADRVVKATLTESAARSVFGDPRLAANGVRGAGRFEGGTDVFSLDQASDGTLVLAWSRGPVFDGPGADLVVFENAFVKRERPDTLYFEPIVVGISADGERYADFPHRYLGPLDEGEDRDAFLREARRAEHWIGFAGMTPVLYHEEQNGLAQGVGPFDRERAGGDAFDLADLDDGEAARGLRETGFRYVRLRAAPIVTGAAGRRYPKMRAGYADVDGVYARYFNRREQR